MLRKLFLGVLVGIGPLTPLVVAGCTSGGSEKPYALTGSKGAISDEERKDQMRWTDDKGRYRVDLRLAGVPPLHYIP